jgi:hypothetical protein
MLKKKSALIRAFVPGDRWVTIYPHIFYTEPIDDGLVAHERVHLKQQGSILKFWLYWYPKYLLSRSFRRDQELEAIIEELLVVHGTVRAARIRSYAFELSFNYAPLWWSRPPFDDEVSARYVLDTMLFERESNASALSR